MSRFLKAQYLWPFFNPVPIARAGAEYVLGPHAYTTAVATIRRLRGRPRETSADN